jgi:transcriptional regulator with XRE-family HTH domain
VGKVINYKESLKSKWGPEEIKAARARANLTLKELSDQLGISLRMLQYYEAGKTPVSKALEDSIRSIVNWEQDNQGYPDIDLDAIGTLTGFDIERINRLIQGIGRYYGGNETDGGFNDSRGAGGGSFGDATNDAGFSDYS